MKVLVACECSGVVRRAFRELGHRAYSVDLKPSEDNSPHHHVGDVRKFMLDGYAGGVVWDLVIAHPPCTYLSASGARWNYNPDGSINEERRLARLEAMEFFYFFAKMAPEMARAVAVENPIGFMSKRFRKPDQIIQPWQFGHPEAKATCLWLKGPLPLLRPTCVLPKPPSGRWENQTPSGQNKLGPSAERATIRSRTYEGIAHAMAEQWGGVAR